ncbi:hypothetical protein C7M51_01577 [Mixta intestinalis]|uniref:Uncharacterized protein n=1 Tax=Mixta intestinalis TaxID=1615494 RepID=A0A6P1PYR0_9GAMM|nr:hypothetical protein C7M51_01577 [Mixta intestinalis]
MTISITLTSEPVQITDGTNGAHVTVERGSVQYADSADSEAWHSLRGTVLGIPQPRVVWMKVWSSQGAEISVTRWTE